MTSIHAAKTDLPTRQVHFGIWRLARYWSNIVTLQYILRSMNFYLE